MKHLLTLNRVLIGLVLLVAGLLKLFSVGAENVAGMLSGFGFPAAMFFAWLLILAEIVTGLMIIANWQMKYAVIPPIIIMIIATFTAHSGNWSNMLIHLTLASNYLYLGYKS